MLSHRVRSSCLSSVACVPLAPEMRGKVTGPHGFILVKFKTGGTSAILAPSWKFGLLLAARSKGRAYHKLLRGKHPAISLAAL